MRAAVQNPVGCFRSPGADGPTLGVLRILLIVNSAASSVTARAKVVIHKALAADHDVTLAETSRRGHATRLAQSAAATGTEVVIALGGDGTLNEAANGLVGTATALAPLPGGSTNVFARIIGVPDDPVEATGVLLDSLAARSIKRVGLGIANGRYFLFHCGVGFDAAVVEQVERRGQLKRWAGHPLFIWSAVDTWIRHYDRRKPAFSLTFDDQPGPDGGSRGPATVDDGYFTIVFNTNPYTYLGNRPFDLAPDATLDRPLTVVTIRQLGLVRIGRVAYSALRGGRGARSIRKVDYRPDIRHVEITGHRSFPYQVDGDFLGYVPSLSFRWEPDVIDLVLPPGAITP